MKYSKEIISKIAPDAKIAFSTKNQTAVREIQNCVGTQKIFEKKFRQDKVKRVSRSGATSFSHEGKGCKSLLKPLWFGTPALRECGGRLLCRQTRRMGYFVDDRSASHTAAARAFRAGSQRTNLPKKPLNKCVQRLFCRICAGNNFKHH